MKTYLLKFILIITCLTISGHFYTAHAQNNKEELDAADFFMILGGIGGDMDNEKKAPVPLPSTFSFINKYVVDMPDGDKLGLYFIDTNNDVSNFEMFEYAHVKKDDQVVARGIVKAVYFYDDRIVRLHGIRLSYEDSDDYTPHSEMYDTLMSTDVIKFFKRILYDKSNNNSIRLLEKGAYYHIKDDYTEYKKSLGIIK